MEATGEAEGFLRPPRLEDAGLEDCALPFESIKEAFLKAATAVRSRTASHDDQGCSDDPWPTIGGATDDVVGVAPDLDHHSPCASRKGGNLPDIGKDNVDLGVDKEAKDKVVGIEVGKEVGKACVDGLQGLEIADKSRDKKIYQKKESEDEDDDEKDGEMPILVEGCM